LLGSILRLNVDQSCASAAYSIPSDNPFINDPNALPEIYAIGLRNPWRFSFDRVTGQLWAGDVGQNAIEEIDIIEAGKNYGWNIAEGSSCYISEDCSFSGLTPPVLEYDHQLRQSVTGGYVYRGLDLNFLSGAYIYGDFVSSIVFIALPNNSPLQGQPLLTAEEPIASFGEDAAGEVYVVGYSGHIFRFVELTQSST